MVRSQQSLTEGSFRLTLPGTCACTCIFPALRDGNLKHRPGKTGSRSGSGPFTIYASDLCVGTWDSHCHNFGFCGSREPNFQKDDIETVYST